MTLRTKTALIAGISLIALLGILHAASRTVLMRSYNRLEQDGISRDIRRVKKEIDGRLTELSTSAVNWARWDDAYAFVQSRDLTFITHNVTEKWFVDQRLNLMAYYSLSGEVLAARGYDLVSGKIAAPPAVFAEGLDKDSPLLCTQTGPRMITGLVLLPEGPMLLAAAAVLPTSEQAEVKGTFIAARFLDQAEIGILARAVDLDLAVQSLNAADLPADFAAAKAALSHDSPPFVQALGRDLIAGYTIRPDLRGTSGIVLRVQAPRDIYLQGTATMRHLLFVALAVGILFGGLTLLLIEKSILTRLSRLTGGVERIRCTGNTALRIGFSGSDEVASLGQSINKMLDAIEQADSLRLQAQRDLRSIFDNVHEAIFVHDVNGSLIDVNDRMLDLYRVSREEACSLDIRKDYSSPDNPVGELSSIWGSVSQGTPRQFEWIARRPHDDSTFPVEVSLRKVALGDRHVILANVRDITERKVAEQTLRESEERLNLALRGADLGLWDWNVQTGEMHLDERWTGMLGYSPDAIEPHVHTWNSLIHPEDAPRVNELVRAHLEARTSVYEAEYRLKAQSGDWVWVLARGRVMVRTRSGKPLRMSGTHLDITSRKKVEMELQQAKTAAEAASQAKSDFLANMSHEIRTPMTSILGFAETLIEHGISESERINAAYTIARNGEYLLSLINDILDLSKIEAGKMSVQQATCPLCQLIAEIASLVRVRADSKKLAFEVEYIGSIPETIQSDPVRLRQILINLIGNAIKFTEVGGVRLVVRFVSGDQPVMQFDIVDTGIGMTPEQAGTLFQPFTQAHTDIARSHGGTGLGLAISKRLAAMLGGDVTIIDTQAGLGTRFRVNVATGNLEGVRIIEDAMSETLQVAEKPEDLARPPARLDCRILLVEDGPDNQRLISHILKKSGAEVDIAENGRIGIEKAWSAIDRGQAYDVILMDMQMPIMDGCEATTLLRQRGYTGTIIALTAHAMAADRAKCLAAGCDGYASKPIDRKALIQLIHTHTTENLALGQAS